MCGRVHTQSSPTLRDTREFPEAYQSTWKRFGDALWNRAPDQSDLMGTNE